MASVQIVKRDRYLDVSLQSQIKQRRRLTGDVGGYWVAHYLAGASVKGKTNHEVMRATFRYHVVNKGWSDIAYHYGIAQDGALLDGCPDDRQSAATKGHNHETRAFVFLLGVGDKITDAQIRTARWLMHVHMPAKGVPFRKVVRHSDLVRTSCPGPSVYSRFDELTRPFLNLEDEDNPKEADTMTYTIEGLDLYISKAYRLVGGYGSTEDEYGRWYWLNQAMEAAINGDDPMDILNYMSELLTAAAAKSEMALLEKKS